MKKSIKFQLGLAFETSIHEAPNFTCLTMKFHNWHHSAPHFAEGYDDMILWSADMDILLVMGFLAKADCYDYFSEKITGKFFQKIVEKIFTT